MIKKILKVLAILVVLLIVGALAVYVGTSPERPASDSSSAIWLEPGPHQVGTAEFVFVDQSRPTDPNRDAPGAPVRTLPTTIWYPVALSGDHPLIIHSHGILSNRTELAYIMEALASRGYVVMATDYPLSNGNAPGGATPNDVANQAGDITFLINTVLAMADYEKPFSGRIDTNRIGLSGYSLGALTTNVATYHARYRDPLVSAAVSIAGLSAPFAPEFFSTTDIPYLAISGTADALLEYRRHASDLPERVPNAALVTIEGGSHLGFLGAADPTFRFMENPDTLGCLGVLQAVGEDPNEAFTRLGTLADGIDMSRDLPGVCDYGYEEAMHPGRQNMIAQIAVVSFFESVFNPDPAIRASAREELEQSLAVDFVEASYR